nr:AraC family transcriptional regulator [uncultured Mediterraneibacter sp.]
MKRKKKQIAEYRYYRMPEGRKVFALLGEKWIQNYGRDIDFLHFHNYMEIGCCYDGHGVLTLGEKDYRFEGGEFSVIPRNYPHTTNSDGDSISRWEYLFVDAEAILRAVFSGTGPMRTEKIIQRLNSRAWMLKMEDYPELGGMVRRILDTMRNKEDFYHEEATGMLAAFFAGIARLTPDNDEKEETGMEESKFSGMISQVLEYVSTHYSEPVRVKELAGMCHISETHFRRIFSSYMNMSPMEYVNQVRIRMACGHLKRTNESVADIAVKCGFSTNSTFNRNFKQFVGVSPMEFRKRPEHYERQLLQYEIHTEEGW